MQTQGIRFQQTGSADVLQLETLPLAMPAADEVLLRHRAIGVNFIDTYHRSGLYPIPLPSGLGLEGAGVIEALGSGVSEFKIGDRVAYAGGPIGAYAEQRLYPAARLVPIPDAISDEIAGSALLRGMTCEYLLRRTFKVEAGMTILIHAAAGGVGQIACQWAKALGAIVIGTVGSDAKAAIARELGCDHVINYSTENFVDRVREITSGVGVPVVYDGVGAATFEGSLDCLSPRGLLVSFGNASGAVPPFQPGILSAKGSLFFTRPTLAHYTATRAELLACAAAFFDIVARGQVHISIGQRYPLAQAAQAHRDLEARTTTGSTILLP